MPALPNSAHMEEMRARVEAARAAVLQQMATGTAPVPTSTTTAPQTTASTLPFTLPSQITTALTPPFPMWAKVTGGALAALAVILTIKKFRK